MKLKSNERNIIGLFSANILTSLFGFISTIILAHYLSPENLGDYYIISSIVIVIIGFTQTGLKRSVIFHTGQKLFDIKTISANLLSLIIVITFVSFTITFFILKPVYNFSILNPIIISISAYIPLKLFLTYSLSLSIGQRRYKTLYLLKLLPAIFLLFGLYFFLIINNYQIKGAFYSQVLSFFISGFFAIYFFKDVFSLKIKFNKNVIISLLKHGILFGFAFILMKLVFKIDLYLIKFLLGSKDAGVYATGVSVVEKIWLFGGATGIITFAETANNATKLNIIKNIKFTFILTLIGGVILFFVSDIFINIFFGERFIDSSFVIKLLLPGIIVFSIFKVLNGYYSGIGKIKIIILSLFPILILNILLNLLLIPKYGINGAAISSSISYITGVIILLIVFFKTKKPSQINAKA